MIDSTPFLKESRTVATTVGSPQVAAAGATEAAIVASMVATTPTTNARTPGNINHTTRRTNSTSENSQTLVTSFWLAKPFSLIINSQFSILNLKFKKLGLHTQLLNLGARERQRPRRITVQYSKT